MAQLVAQVSIICNGETEWNELLAKYQATPPSAEGMTIDNMQYNNETFTVSMTVTAENSVN